MDAKDSATSVKSQKQQQQQECNEDGVQLLAVNQNEPSHSEHIERVPEQSTVDQLCEQHAESRVQSLGAKEVRGRKHVSFVEDAHKLPKGEPPTESKYKWQMAAKLTNSSISLSGIYSEQPSTSKAAVAAQRRGGLSPATSIIDLLELETEKPTTSKAAAHFRQLVEQLKSVSLFDDKELTLDGPATSKTAAQFQQYVDQLKRNPLPPNPYAIVSDWEDEKPTPSKVAYSTGPPQFGRRMASVSPSPSIVDLTEIGVGKPRAQTDEEPYVTFADVSPATSFIELTEISKAEESGGQLSEPRKSVSPAHSFVEFIELQTEKPMTSKAAAEIQEFLAQRERLRSKTGLLNCGDAEMPMKGYIDYAAEADGDMLMPFTKPFVYDDPDSPRSIKVREYVQHIEQAQAEFSEARVSMSHIVFEDAEGAQSDDEPDPAEPADPDVADPDVADQEGIADSADLADLGDLPGQPSPRLEDLEQEAQDINERFKQIMDLFDSFTKNLESLDLPLSNDPSKTTGKRTPATPSNALSTQSEDTAEDAAQSEGPGKSPPTPEPPTAAKSKDVYTTISGTNLVGSAIKQQVTIACQTSTSRLPVTGGPCAGATTTRAVCSEPVHSSGYASNYPTDCHVETYIIEPNTAASGGEATAAKPISTETSRVKLLKSAATPSTAAQLSATSCERTFHTIHIDANSSPSSSVMRRPPLLRRLWHVVTDLCGAICLCLQVNKDCIFCLGFFIAFVVSASFLTAFFYRTLSVNPQLIQHQHQFIENEEEMNMPNSKDNPLIYL